MNNSPDNTGRKQDRRFRKGRSGNPAGRPQGSRNKTTLAVDALLDGEAETLTRKAIEKAKDGDVTALRLCLDRIAPVRKDRPVTFSLPTIACASDAAKASAALVAAVSLGEITPSEAVELGRLLESYVRALEVTEIEDRLNKLERMLTQ
jgi:flavoprotein